jgi:hypothetical protein
MKYLKNLKVLYIVLVVFGLYLAYSWYQSNAAGTNSAVTASGSL